MCFSENITITLHISKLIMTIKNKFLSNFAIPNIIIVKTEKQKHKREVLMTRGLFSPDCIREKTPCLISIFDSFD